MPRTPFSQLDALVQSLLRDSPPRVPSGVLEFSGPPQSPTDLDAADQRAVSAVGTLLIWKLIQHGGSNLAVGPAAKAAERLMASFPEMDQRRLESEAMNIFRWLEDALNLLGDDWESDESGMYPWEDREFPDNGRGALIDRAIRERLDLQIEYFTYRRNSISERRITPRAIENGRILLAQCHWRGEERRFALHRIKQAHLLAEAVS